MYPLSMSAATRLVTSKILHMYVHDVVSLAVKSQAKLIGQEVILGWRVGRCVHACAAAAAAEYALES